MSDIPPPPPPPQYQVPTPFMGKPPRPGLVTAAGVILIIIGALAFLVALALLSAASSGRLGNTFVDPDSARLAGTITLIQAPLDLLAGILVLRLSKAGRVLAIVMAAVGVLGGLAQLSSNGAAIVGLGLNAFVIIALATQGQAFQRMNSG